MAASFRKQDAYQVAQSYQGKQAKNLNGLVTLKLPWLKLDFYLIRLPTDTSYIPRVIVLWGSRGAQVKIFIESFWGLGRHAS